MHNEFCRSGICSERLHRNRHSDVTMEHVQQAAHKPLNLGNGPNGVRNGFGGSLIAKSNGFSSDGNANTGGSAIAADTNGIASSNAHAC